MNILTRYIIITTHLIYLNINAQEYSSPIDQKISLSGTFGELRTNHFHAGIDIRTGGVEGKNIYSIDEGYISRIKVSSWGYGKAIYINHPNGKTSVYAHLKQFSSKINQIIKKIHYERESYEIEYYPKKNKINSTGTFNPCSISLSKSRFKSL